MAASRSSDRAASGARPLWLWLAWRFALVGMLPLLLVAMLGVWVLLPQVRAGIETNHQGLARAIAGQVEAHLLGAGRELSALAAYLGQRGGQPASFWYDPLDAHAGTGDVFAAIYIVAVDNSLYAVGLPLALRGQRDDLLKLDLSRWAVVREAREHRHVVWSEVFLSAVSARLTVSLAIPVGEQLLVGEVAIDRLSEFLGRLPGDSGMVTMIFDRRGQVIAHSQPRLGGQQLNLGHLPIVERALQGQLATGELELDGETYIGTPVSVPQLGWTVLVAQTRERGARTAAVDLLGGGRRWPGGAAPGSGGDTAAGTRAGPAYRPLHRAGPHNSRRRLRSALAGVQYPGIPPPGR
jgi:hypothetical protein